MHHVGWNGLNISLTRLTVYYRGISSLGKQQQSMNMKTLISPDRAKKAMSKSVRGKACIVWEGEPELLMKQIRFGQKKFVHNLMSHQYLVSCQNTIEVPQKIGWLNFCPLTISPDLYQKWVVHRTSISLWYDSFYCVQGMTSLLSQK